MKGILRYLLIAILLSMGFTAYSQNFKFSRYIMFTDTITDEGVTFAASSDDAEQENDEIDTLFDDDIDAGWEGEPEDQNILTAGMRFRDIFIPKGARIDSAFIIVHSHEAKTAEDVARLTIVGEASDNAQTFTEDELIDVRPQTMTSLLWEVAEPWGLWTPHRTLDIAPIVQEIIDRDGWLPGNALSFIFLGEDQGPSEVENAREWESFENISDPEDGGDGQNYPDRVPELVIYYSVASGVVEMPIVFTDTITDEGVTFAASSDDAEQENDEIDSLFDDDIDAGWEGEPEDQNILTAGLRFQNLVIPQGAKIDSAYILVHSHEAKTAEDVARITIVGDATDDAVTFTEDALIDARPRTEAQLLWEVAEPWGLWTPHRTMDLSPIVQEIVNREGWTAGNSMAFILLGEDQGPSEVENAREFESYENIADPEDGGDGQNYPERVPRLFVYYSMGTETSAEEAYPLYPIAVTKTNNADGIPDSLSVQMSLQGIVHSINFRGDNGLGFAILDDQEDGTYVFSQENPFNYNVTLGDEVLVKGFLTQFNGLTEIVPDSLTVLTAGNSLFTPLLVDSLGEYTESQFIQIGDMNNALTLVDASQWTNMGSGFNVDVTDGVNTFEMRIDADTELYNEPAPTEPFYIIGIGGQFDNEAPYDSGYQVFPRILADLIITNTVDPTFKQSIAIYPNPASASFTVETNIGFDRVIMTNNLGQQIIELQNVNGIRTVDVSTLSKGFYNLSFVKGDRIWTERLAVN